MAYPMNYPNQQPYGGLYGGTPYPMGQPQNNSVGITWVLGEAGAKSYLVSPNTTVALWDSENPVIYLKSADSSGMPSMKVIDYKVRENASSAPNLLESKPKAEYVTKLELDEIRGEIESLRAQLDKRNNNRPQDNHAGNPKKQNRGNL